ncbi:MAG: GNAT family N-acetyltransferase [Solirubrobacteraceae bacterium]|nr:GNAT family N-acetyltransferase [Solirubrobacteraceae bacterium]
MSHRLPNGTEIRLRPIQPDDKIRLQRGLAHLSLESTVQRFLGPKPGFSGAELRYLTEVDGIDHVAIVAVTDQPDGDEELVAVGRFVRDPERPEYAEVAITVGDELQGQGLGTLLGTTLAAEARLRGIRHFTALLQGTNEAAQRLFARISNHLTTELRDGVREVVADLPTLQHTVVTP